MESVAWNEALMFLWTGSATASAVVGLAQNVQASFNHGLSNDAALNGHYRDHATGRRADVLIGGYLSYGSMVERFEQAQRLSGQSLVPLHMKLVHSAPGLGVSGGRILWSGAIDMLTWLGSEGQPFSYMLQYHANEWSAF